MKATSIRINAEYGDVILDKIKILNGLDIFLIRLRVLWRRIIYI